MNRMRQAMADKNLGLRWLGFGLLLLATACAGQNVGLGPKPDRVWASSRTLSDARACVIRALDDYGRSESVQAPSVTHAAHTIEAGSLYEIRPDANLGANSGNYYVRLEKTDDHITRISLFAESPWRGKLVGALSGCRTR
jgi:hypothetical protein